MAKIGTAHVEIKPVLNEEALDAIVQRIEEAIEAGMTRALAKSNQRVGKSINDAASGALRIWQDGKPVDQLNVDPTRSCPCRPENGGSGVCGCTLGGPRVTC